MWLGWVVTTVGTNVLRRQKKTSFAYYRRLVFICAHLLMMKNVIGRLLMVLHLEEEDSYIRRCILEDESFRAV